MASEVGVVDVDPSEILQKGRLKPGRMLLADVQRKELTSDNDIKHEICTSRPAREWLRKFSRLEDLHEIYKSENPNFEEVMNSSMIRLHRNVTTTKAKFNKTDIYLVEEDRRLPLFGYNVEVLSLLLLPMIKHRKESLGSMGNDAPLACLSMQNPMIYDYFKQLFAQVIYCFFLAHVVFFKT